MRNRSGQSPSAFLLGILLVLFFASISILGPVYAATTDTVSFQSKLTNADGTNISNGTYNFRFRMYSVSSGGSVLWSEDRSLSVNAGVVSVDLGASQSFPSDLFDNANLYLQICFDANGTDSDSSDANCGTGSHRYEEVFSTRKAITAVPVALRAKYLTDSAGNSYGVNSFFRQGGNSFGATGVLGTLDANNLEFVTNNSLQMQLLSTGGVDIASYLAIGNGASVTSNKVINLYEQINSNSVSLIGQEIYTFNSNTAGPGTTGLKVTADGATLTGTNIAGDFVAWGYSLDGETAYGLRSVAYDAPTLYGISARVAGSGNTGMARAGYFQNTGVNLAAGSAYGIEVSTISGSTSGNVEGIMNYSKSTGANSYVYGIDNTAEATNSGSTVYGLLSYSSTTGSGSTLYGGYIEASSQGNLAESEGLYVRSVSSGDTSAMAGVHIDASVTGTDTVFYGLLINTTNSGTGNTEYGIWQDSQNATNVYYGKNGFGINTPTELLTIADGNILLNNGGVYSAFGGFGRYQNLLLNSEDFSTTWSVLTGSVTTNTVTAPNGELTADTLNIDGSNSFVWQNYAGTVSPATNFAYSIWLRAASDTTVTIMVRDDNSGAPGGMYSKTVTVTQQWQRFTVAGSISSSGGVGIGSYVINPGGSPIAVYAWGAQLEKATNPGVYVATNNSVNGPAAQVGGLVANGQSLFTGSVGIGTYSPDRRLEIVDVNPQLRLTYTDASDYADIYTDSNGYLYLDPSSGLNQVFIGPSLTMGTTGATSFVNHANGSIQLQNVAMDGTSGTKVAVEVVPVLMPDSGNMNLVGLKVAPVIMQSGTASGSYTAFLVDVAETSVLGTNNYLARIGAGGNYAFEITDGGVSRINGGLGIRETGTSPTYYTVFQGGDQAGDITYTLPTASSNGVLTNTGGVLSWAAGGGGGISQVGSMTSSLVFGDATADDDWLGLGASAGRIEFDDLAIDEVNILGARVGIGTSTPTDVLSLVVNETDNAVWGGGMSMFYDYAPTSAGTGYPIGILNSVSVGSGNINGMLGLIGIQNEVSNDGSGDIDNLIGMITSAYNSGANQVTSIIGASISAGASAGAATNLIGLNVSANDTIPGVTNIYGIYVAAYNDGIGDTQNRYTLYLAEDEDGSTAVNDFGLYSADPNVVNYFAGNVGIGTASPTSFLLQVAGDIGPDADDTYDLGSSSLRFRDLYLGGNTLHIGSSLTDEGTISYNTTTNVLGISTDSTTNGDIAFFTNQLFLDKSSGNVGIGTTSPLSTLNIADNTGPVTLTSTLLGDPGTTGALGRYAFRAETTEAPSWTTAYNTPESTVSAFAYDYENGVLYAAAGGGNGVIYRCVVSSGCDISGDWAEVYDAASLWDQPAIVFDAATNTIFSTSDGVVSRCDTSTGCDAPGDWANVFTSGDDDVLSLGVDTANSVLYVGSAWTQGIIYRCDIAATSCDASGDFTTSFDTPDDGLTSMVYDAANGTMYAGSEWGGEIYRCDTATDCDTGTDWTVSGDLPGTGNLIHALAIDTTNEILYATSDDVIYRCPLSSGCDALTDWSVSYDTNLSGVYSLGYDAVHERMFAGTGNTGIVYQCATSTGCDSSSDWSVSYDSTQTSILSIGVVNGVVYAGSGNGGFIYRFNDSTSPTYANYAAIEAYAVDTVTGSEDGRLSFKTMLGGTEYESLRVAGNASTFYSSLSLGTSSAGYDATFNASGVNRSLFWESSTGRLIGRDGSNPMVMFTTQPSTADGVFTSFNATGTSKVVQFGNAAMNIGGGGKFRLFNQPTWAVGEDPGAMSAVETLEMNSATGSIGINPSGNASAPTTENIRITSNVNVAADITGLYVTGSNPGGTWKAAYFGGNVGINTTGPDAQLDVLGTSGQQLRLSYADGTAYTGFVVDSSGNLSIVNSGTYSNINSSLRISETLSIREGGTSPTYRTIFQGGDQAGDITYTLPTASTNGFLQNTGGVLSWAAGSSSVTVGSMTGGTLFADATADDDWLGLGASAGRIAFDDQTTDYVNILDANVGIGIAAPTERLHIANNGDTYLNINATNGSGQISGLKLQRGTWLTDTYTDYSLYVSNGDFMIDTLDDNVTTNVFHIDGATGYTGIGMSTTANRLAVKGGRSVAAIGVSNLITADGTFATSSGWTAGSGWSIGSGVATHATGNTATLSGTTGATDDDLVYQVNFTVAVTTAGDGFTVSLGGNDAGTTITTAGTKVLYIRPTNLTGTLVFTPGAAGTFVGTIDDVTVYAIDQSNADILVQNSNGTTNPLELRAGGSGALSTFIGTNAGRYNTTTGGGGNGLYNTFVGYNSGRFNATGNSNTTLGHYALSRNTTGYSNTAIGTWVLEYNISGYRNSAFGDGSLGLNTTGYENSGFGMYSLGENTTGSRNVALGYAALEENTTGHSNISVGSRSGRYLADGTTPNTNSIESIFIGTDTEALAASGTNEIVIGYGAEGLGSNSVVLGNDSIIKTLLRGNVGIGASSSNQLYVYDGQWSDVANPQVLIYGVDNETQVKALSIVDENDNEYFYVRSTTDDLGETYFKGDVGIGVESPAYALSVQAAAGQDAINWRNPTYELGRLGYSTDNNSGWLGLYSNGSAKVEILANGESYFNGGDVGIGLDYANSRLHVKGASSLATVGVSNLITADGTFASSSGWTEGTGWSIGTGVATHATGNTGTLSGTSTAIDTSTVYQVNFTVSVTTAGDGITVSLGGQESGDVITTSGSKTVYIVPSAGTGTLVFTPGPLGTFVGTIDDVTIYALTGSLADAEFESSNGSGSNIEIRAGRSASNNTFIGTNAGNFSTINGGGTYNTYVGYGSGRYTVTGSRNTALGTWAFNQNTTGYRSTAIGYSALGENTTGYRNTALGSNALELNTTGYDNAAVGTYALNVNTTGYENTSIGIYSLEANTTGNRNVAIGFASLENNTTGYRNTAIGSRSGRYLADGVTSNTNSISSIFIGSDTEALAASGTNEIVIGYGAEGLGSNSVVLGNSSITKTLLRGNVGIGASSSNQLYVYNSQWADIANPQVLIYGVDNETQVKALSIVDENNNEYFYVRSSPDDKGETYFNGDVGIGVESPAYKLAVGGTLGILEGGTSPSFYTIFQGGDQSANLTYTLPTTSTNGVLTNNAGVLSWVAGGGGGIGQVGSMMSTPAFGDSTADDDWLGLGASAGRIAFDDQAIDYVNILDANVGIGYATPTARLDIQGTVTEASLGAEMITATADRDFSSWTGNWSGTDWAPSGDGRARHLISVGFSHPFSLSNAALSAAPASGNVYKITFTVETSTVGSLLVSIGGANSGVLVGKQLNTETHTVVITATGTGALTFTPNTGGWEGYLDDISVVQVTPANAVEILRNADGTIGSELRAGGSALYNTFVGNSSGQANTTGYNNAALGRQALGHNVTGYRNSAVGYNALYENTIGHDNVAFGTFASRWNNIGNYNTSVGVYALGSSTSGSYNTSIGYQSLYNVTSGNNNTAFGSSVGYSLSTGANNVLFGYQAGDNLTSGSNNIVIGYNVDAPSATASNQLNIGNFIFGTGIDGTGTTVSNGKIGIGTNAPHVTFDVTGTGAFNALGVKYITGSIDPTASTTVTGTGTLFLSEVDPGDRIALDGTATITGSIDPTASTAVTGVGTLFLTELKVGDQITVNAETRTVIAIASNTSLTVGVAFTDTANDTSIVRTSTEIRTVVSIASNTSLTVDRAYLDNSADSQITVYRDTFDVTGAALFKGGALFTGLGTPDAPTVTPQGTTGAATWTYKISVVNATGNETVLSANGSTTSGNATLSGTNFNRITWSATPGAAAYRIYRVATGTSPNTTGYIGTVDAHSTLQFDDTGIGIMGGYSGSVFDETSNVGIGTLKTPPRDTLTVDGRINQTWHYMFEDFFGGRANQTANAVINAGNAMSFAIIGTSGCTASYPSVANGVYRMTSGATAALGCLLSQAGTAGLPNIKQVDVSLAPVLEVVLNPGATSAKTMIVGFSNQTTATVAEPTAGLYFYASTAGTPSDQWIAVARNASVSTTQATGVTTNTNTYQVLRIEASATHARYYINDVLVADLRTNIPASGATLEFVVGHATTAAAAKTVDIDSIEFWQDDPVVSGMPGQLPAGFDGSNLLQNHMLYSDTTYAKGASEETIPEGYVVSFTDSSEFDDNGKNRLVYNIEKSKAGDKTVLGIGSGLIDPNAPFEIGLNPYAVALYGPTYAWVEEGGETEITLGQELRLSSKSEGVLSVEGGQIIARSLESVDWSVIEEVEGQSKRKLIKVFVMNGGSQNSSLVAGGVSDYFTAVDDSSIQTPYRIIANSLVATTAEVNVLKSRTLNVNDNFLVDDEGNVSTTGSLFAGAIETPVIKGVAGGLNINIGEQETFTVSVGDTKAIEASVKGVKVNNLLVSEQQAGKVTLPAGRTTITVSSELVTAESVVVVTPNIPVVTAVKTNNGYFVISIATASSQDIELAWYVVNIDK